MAVEADITPVIVNIDGLTFSGNNVLAATLVSPQFALNDYRSTPFATAGGSNLPRGSGGFLSQDDAGNQLQLQDATMRAQFNKMGTSNYHLILHANVLPTVSEPTQSGSANVGRYTLLGDLNPFPGFRQPATGCT